MRWIAWGMLFVIAGVQCGVVNAEQGVMVLQASTLEDRPVRRLVLTTKGDGAMAAPTDDQGKTRIRLGSDTRPGYPVKLQVANKPDGKDLIIMSPRNGEVIVPCFENTPFCMAPLFLTDKGNKAILAKGRGLTATTELVNHATIARELEQKNVLPQEQRRAVLEEQARALGLPADDVDRAIRGSGAQTEPASYQKGLAALYEQRYNDATQSIKAALRVSDPGQYDKYVSLGWAEYRLRHYESAKETLQKAQTMRPDDPRVLEILSGVYRALRDFPNARISMEKAVARGPATSGALYALAIMQKNDLQLDRRYELALRSLEKAKTLSRDRNEIANIDLVIAGYLIHAGQRQEGLRRFESVKDQFRDDQFAINRAWFYAVAEREQEFYGALERALQVQTAAALIWVDQEVDIDKYRKTERFKTLMAKYPKQ